MVTFENYSRIDKNSMKHISIILFSLLLVIPTGILAKDASSDWLTKLDASLANREQYESQHVERIEGLKKELAKIEKLPNKTADSRYYDLMYQLYNE